MACNQNPFLLNISQTIGNANGENPCTVDGSIGVASVSRGTSGAEFPPGVEHLASLREGWMQSDFNSFGTRLEVAAPHVCHDELDGPSSSSAGVAALALSIADLTFAPLEFPTFEDFLVRSQPVDPEFHLPPWQIYTPSGHEVGTHGMRWLLDTSAPPSNSPPPPPQRTPPNRRPRPHLPFLRSRQMEIFQARNADRLRARNLNREAHSLTGNGGKDKGKGRHPDEGPSRQRYDKKKLTGRQKKGRDYEAKWNNRQRDEDELDEPVAYEAPAPKKIEINAPPAVIEPASVPLIITEAFFNDPYCPVEIKVINIIYHNSTLIFQDVNVMRDYLAIAGTTEHNGLLYLAVTGPVEVPDQPPRIWNRMIFRQRYEGTYNPAWGGLMCGPTTDMTEGKFFYTFNPRHGKYVEPFHLVRSYIENTPLGKKIIEKTELFPGFYVPPPPNFPPRRIVANPPALTAAIQWMEDHGRKNFQVACYESWRRIVKLYVKAPVLEIGYFSVQGKNHYTVPLLKNWIVRNMDHTLWTEADSHRNPVYAVHSAVDFYYEHPLPNMPLYSGRAVYFKDQPVEFANIPSVLAMLNKKPKSNFPLLRGLLDVLVNPSPIDTPEVYTFDQPRLKHTPVTTQPRTKPMNILEENETANLRSCDMGFVPWEPGEETPDRRPVNMRHGAITHAENKQQLWISTESSEDPRTTYKQARASGQSILRSLRTVGEAEHYVTGSIANKKKCPLNVEHNVALDLLTSRVTPHSVLNNPRETSSRMERFVNSASHVNSDHSNFVMQETTLYAQLLSTQQFNRSMVRSGAFRKQLFPEGPPLLL